MAEVITFSRKGAFKVPPERLKFQGLDLVHEVGGIVGGTGSAEKTDYREGRIKVVGYEPLVEIARYDLGNGRFLDAVVDFTGMVKPLGIGALDEKGEPSYEKDLTDKEFPLSLGGISREDYESIKQEVEEALKEGLVENGEGKDPLELVKSLLSDRKKLRMVSPTAFILTKGLSDEEAKEVLKEPTVITKEELLKKGERLTLNGIAVGVDQKGNLVIGFLPERVPLIPTTKLAKELYSRRPEFKFFGYFSKVSLRDFKNDERRDKLIKKFNSFTREIKEKKSQIPPETLKKVKEVLEKIKEVLEEPSEEKVKEVRRLAGSELFRILKEHIKEEGLYTKPLKELVVSSGDKMFLRNNPDNAGMPLIDYRKVDRIGVVSLPRVVRTPEEGWKVKRVPKPLIMGELQEGRLKPIPTKADSLVLSREYRIYKAVKPFYEGKINGKEVSLNQLKSLYGKGFDDFKGLEAIKEELGQYKAAMQLVSFIDYLREKIGDVLFKEGATVEEISKALKEDKVINEFMEGMREYLASRGKYKAVDIREYYEADVEPGKVVSKLASLGVIKRDAKTGEFRVSPEAKKLDKKLREELGLKTSLRNFATLVAMTYNSSKYLKEAQFPPLDKEAEKVLAQIQRAVSFGERGMPLEALPYEYAPNLRTSEEENEELKALKQAWGNYFEAESQEKVAEVESEVEKSEVVEAQEEEENAEVVDAGIQAQEEEPEQTLEEIDDYDLNL